ncbi:MAG TPA: hypothetical protein VE422_47125 [Terriglobia bacterium]|nr:hypothetical protein [Terriglobia bacterium]
MAKTITSRLHFILAIQGLLILLPLHVYSQGSAQAKIPDFSGVWRTINAPDAPREGTSLRWLPRAGELPSFTPEYKAKYDKIQVSRESGSEETEPVARCLPPGMPWFTLAQYGLEILQTRDKIAFFSEWMDSYRRVYLDGRKPAKDLDPSYNGYSTGHWEGDTLVVETVGLRDDTTLDRYGSPHSDAMTIAERFRLSSPDVLEDKITVSDPRAFTKPWEFVRTYRRAGSGNDELHENTCAESLKLAK